MKLIDEGIARLSEQAAAKNWPNGKLYNAIYCMGLERAAKVAEQHFIYGHAVAGPGFAAICATKIRALGDGA